MTTIERLLGDLIAQRSVNPELGGTGEAALAQWVADELRRTGADVWMQPVREGRHNVLAALRAGEGPAILLEAHLDTVAAGAGWQRDPFAASFEEGRVYGRGACDTKGSLATFLSVFTHFAQQPKRLAAPLIFAATIDEEVGQSGAFALMKQDLKIAGAITGEPTGCRVVHAHKGFVRFAVESVGRAAHSSRPDEGDNAIIRMGEVLRGFANYAADLAQRPVHAALGRGTVNVGTIVGGIGVNVVPDRCVIRVDRRTIPGETAVTVQQEVEAQLHSTGQLRVTEVMERPPLYTPLDAPLVTSLLAASEAIGMRHEPEAAPYLTNAVAYAAAGVPAVVFGPGDLAQAHRPDEWIAVAELHRAHDLLCLWLESQANRVVQTT